jgi:hypothetical protein
LDGYIAAWNETDFANVADDGRLRAVTGFLEPAQEISGIG